jgi:small-conductance mechanosensitive channel
MFLPLSLSNPAHQHYSPKTRLWALIVAILVTFFLPFSLDAQEQNATKSKIEAVRLELNQIEAGITVRTVSDKTLQDHRKRVEELARELKSVSDELTPKADAIRSRLKELGPKPDDKSAPESADITKEREERDRALKELDESVKLARALSVQADQIMTAIADQRRSIFTNKLFERSASIVSPQLWLDVIGNIGHDLRALGVVSTDTLNRIIDSAGAFGTLTLAIAIGFVIAGAAVIRRKALEFMARDTLFGEPTPFRVASRATLLMLISLLVPVTAVALIVTTVDSLDILPSRVEPVFSVVLWGLVYISFVRGLAEAVLSPTRAEWRVIPLSDESATRIVWIATHISILILADSTFETVSQAIAAGLGLTVLTKAIFSVLIVWTLVLGLKSITSTPKGDASEAILPEPSSSLAAILRIIGWSLVIVILGSVLLGYSAFSAFLADQISWIGIIVTLIYLLARLSALAIEGFLLEDTRFSSTLRTASGLSKRSLEQLGVLLSGAVQVLILGLGLLLALAPWGVESGDVLYSLKAAIFGFTIGDVTFSFAAAFSAIVFFGIAILVTRAVQRWLTAKYLPHTQLDSGIRNSITTGIGYLGFLVAMMLSLSTLGLSLDKITIVAGALSVGIGFGLQSIVNNFVSGLILLWERGIRVGDWIVVGEEQGIVKRINVRATEIETFDKAVMIVPNSSLISGTVKNRVHSNRMGRIVIPVPVNRDADSAKVAEILASIATANRSVLKKPEPTVHFKRIGDTVKEFELVCFIGEVDDGSKVTSDLIFNIDRQLMEIGIGDTKPRTVLTIEGLSTLEERINRIEMASAPEQKSVNPGTRKRKPS